MGGLSMTMPLVEASNVSRRFGDGETAVEALHPASLSISPGDRIALVGPSGSGKSTLLNLIAGLDEPSSGTIAWPGLGGREQLRPLAIGMIHQFSSLVPTLSVAENVALPLRLGHCTEILDSVAQALDAMGLAALSDHLPDELSGGQAQRVAVARALAHRPKLLIGDEPTGQLDRDTGRSVLDTLLTHASSSTTAIVIATHDRSVADRMEDIWTVEHGHLRNRTVDIAA
jgi:putative ABC transport system ATP-binding protein/lipoprotein-releasing system ATP-binding protein